MNMPLKADGTVEFRATLFAVIREVVYSYFPKISFSILVENNLHVNVN
jgi:hypothetical protein